MKSDIPQAAHLYGAALVLSLAASMPAGAVTQLLNSSENCSQWQGVATEFRTTNRIYIDTPAANTFDLLVLRDAIGYSGGQEVLVAICTHNWSYQWYDGLTPLDGWTTAIEGKVLDFSHPAHFNAEKSTATVQNIRTAYDVAGTRSSLADLNSYAVTTTSPGWAGGRVTMPADGSALKIAFSADAITDINGGLIFFVGPEEHNATPYIDFALAGMIPGDEYTVDINGGPAGTEFYLSYLVLADSPGTIIDVSEPIEVTGMPPGC